jgi:type IV secretion system protein VirB10
MSHGRRSILRFAPSAERRSHAGKRRDLARARYRADRGMTPSKRNTALIFAGTAMVLGILWVNSGTSQQASNRDLTAPGGAAQERRDIVARETVDYAAVAPQPRPLGAGGSPHAPVLNPAAGVPGPDGQIVPAMQPGAAPGPTGGTGAQPIWRTRRDDRHSSPMAGAISVGRPRKARRRRPRARNRPKIQERQGVRRAGRPMRWICLGKAQP